jgi:putative YhdH/YhfP family quinone oxidoreductase
MTKAVVIGAGPTGLTTAMLLAQRGFEVVAATRKLAENGYLKRLGAAQVIESTSVGGADKPLEPALWQGAIDSLGGDPLSLLTRTVQRDGVIASIGNAAGLSFSTSVMPFILRGVRLIGVNSDNDPALRSRIWQRLAGDLRPRHLSAIANVRPFEELPSLIDAVVNGRVRGRTVIALPTN